MGFLFSKQKYDPDRDIPDLTGKVALVTGANAGIGFEVSLQLAKRGAKVYLGCRSESKAREAIARIHNACPELKGDEVEKRLVWLPLDLTLMKSTKQAAERLLEMEGKEGRLDILVNNAGVSKDYELTEEGISLIVAVNHLGHFVFTETVLPLMKKTAQIPGADIRIVAISSGMYRFPGTTDFTSLEAFNSIQSSPKSINAYTSILKRYGTSKLMNVLHVAELQRRLDKEGTPITAISLHPGAANTAAWWVRLLMYPLRIEPSEGAYTPLFAATSAEVAADRDKYKGKYLEPYGKLVDMSKDGKDEGLARTLWGTSERILKGLLD